MTRIFKRARQHMVWVMMFAVIFMGMQLVAGEKQEINKSFSAKEVVKIQTVSGDCLIQAGKGNKISVNLVYNYSTDYYTPTMTEEGNTLILKEEFKKRNTWTHGHNKTAKWTVTVPEKTKIEFSSASGDLKVHNLKSELSSRTASGDVKLEGFKGTIKVKAASGDIKVFDSEGNFMVKTASGDLKFEDVKGEFEAKCASGDIKIIDLQLTGASVFATASGDVRIKMAKTSAYDFSLSAASGDIHLDYNGNAVKGYFEFKGHKDEMSSDISFDGGDSGKYSRHVTKYFKRGGDSPKVTIKTASGDIKFRK
jgi:DUF4097 and DUF4098 domain-containing protein YvlB